VLYDNVNQLILSGFSCNNSKAESDVFIDRLVQLILSDFSATTPPPSPQYFPINYTSLFYRVFPQQPDGVRAGVCRQFRPVYYIGIFPTTPPLRPKCCPTKYTSLFYRDFPATNPPPNSTCCPTAYASLFYINCISSTPPLWTCCPTTEPTIFYQRFVATTPPLRLPYFQIDYTNWFGILFFQQLKRLWVVVQRQQPQFTFVKYVWQWLNRQPIRELIVSPRLRLYFSSSDASLFQ
jgi:hypothetical protein